MTLQLQTLGLKVIARADCTVWNQHPDMNHDGGILGVGTIDGGRYRSLLKFDIPDSEEIENAVLMLFAEAATGVPQVNPPPCFVKFTDQDWGEKTITWNNQPPPSMIGGKEVFGATPVSVYTRDWFGIEVDVDLINAYRGRTLTLILVGDESYDPATWNDYFSAYSRERTGYEPYLAINAYVPPQTCAVNFIVADEAGTPLDLAYVTLGGLEAWTDPSGLAMFGDIPLGTYNWTAYKDGYNSKQGISNFTEETTYELIVTLTAAVVTPCLVGFSVQDAATGLPLEGAECRLGVNSLLTDEGGLATFTGVEPAVYNWAIILGGYQSKSGSIECVAGGEYGIDEALVKHVVDGARVWWLISAGAVAVGLIYLQTKTKGPS